MAVDAASKTVYHSPTSVAHGRQRRSSGRKSFTSTALPPGMESPRTLCPRDGDAFSYDPTHLPRWDTPQELWERLPQQLKAALTNMQHAGAAVLTGFERLEHHSGDLDIGPGASPDNPPEDELLVQLDESYPRLLRSNLKLRTTSNASSRYESSLPSPAILPSPSSDSGTPPSLSASQELFPTSPISPISPICLTPADANFPSKRDRSRERSFSTPLEPHNAYYATELSELRTVSVPRLRHRALKVDTEWSEVRRSGALTADDVNGFENWWAEKQCAILSLDKRCKRLSIAMGIAPTGMGWTAP